METKLLQLSYSLDNIDAAVKQFWEVVHTFGVLAFSGEMGAGKTTFIHKLCDHLEVQDAVSSPTFALINEYRFNGADSKERVIYHMDWYRLRDSQEAFNAGMEDCVDQAASGKAYCFIEWPEKAAELLHPPYLWITITSKNITDRDMSVTLIS
jgi:tRNA threonylcarbamoyladenosine biosynthesis protein TsaE